MWQSQTNLERVIRNLLCFQYDELVPSTMRTKYGGFYINTGELDFVSVDDASQDGQPFKKKMKKVIKIVSSG